jgi:phosphodiesterase/alkaline phosphatase D-like protein
MRRSLLVALIGGLALVGGAAAASAPAAVTGPVTASGSTSATVGGTVNPNGQATTWLVQYGKTTSYGSQTGAFNAGAGTTNTAVSTTLNGLAPGTTYHYRFVATNATGTTQGADAVLTTSGAPAPDAVTGGAGGISSTTAILTGSVNPNGRPTTAFFEYGTSTSYGSRTASQNGGAGTSATNVSAQVTGLRAGQTYHFRLVAASDGGTSHGTDQRFTAGSAPSVSTASASSVSTTGARLNGRVNPNGHGTTWQFEYGTSASYGASTPAHGAGSGTGTANVSASLSGLVPGTTYHFRLVASNSSGTTAGGDQTFTTVATPVVATGSAGVGVTTATLNGTVDPKNQTTTWYFEYGTTTGYGSRTPGQRADANTGSRAVSTGVSNLAPGTTYHFRIVATSSTGTSRGADVAFTTIANTVSLATSSFKIVSGHFVMLSGAVSSGQPGVNVTVLAQRFGDSALASVATVLTGDGGKWTYPAQPTIRTSYVVNANGVSSPSVTVGVRPSVSLRVTTRARVATHVGGATSFAGRRVQLQRLSHGAWVTVKRARLNGSSTTTFRLSLLPKGKSTIRIAFSVNQAGPGYLGGFSRQLNVRR